MCVKVMWMTHFSIQLIYLIDCSVEPTLWGPRFDHRRPPQLSVLLTSRYLKVRRLKEKVKGYFISFYFLFVIRSQWKLFEWSVSGLHFVPFINKLVSIVLYSLSWLHAYKAPCCLYQPPHHPLPTEKAAISCNLWWYFLHKKEAIISFFSLLTECNLGKKACYKHSISP